METENKRNPAVEKCTDIHYLPYQNQWLVKGHIFERGEVFVRTGYIYIDALPTEEEVNAIYPEAIRKF